LRKGERDGGEGTQEKLYKKYGLAKEEIEFIESMIRPMELGEGNAGEGT